MATLDELEAALRKSWDRDTLAVYADHLQSLGELRGELIVIDLRIEEVGPEPALVARRKELLAAWLATLPPGKVQHGFLDVDATGASPVEQVKAAFASPAARYIRTVAIAGAPSTVRESIKHVANEERTGLARIVIRQWDGGSTTLPVNICVDLFDATPDLDTLELDGYRICSDVAHRSLRRARISGSNAIASLIDRSDKQWLALAEIDFAFGSHIGGPMTDDSIATDVLPRRRLPALRSLDLSRNQPGFLDPDHLGTNIDVFRAVMKLNILSQLRVLRLPPIPAQWKSITASKLSQLRLLEELYVGGVRQELPR